MSFRLKFSSTNTDFTTYLNPRIEFDRSKNYEVAFLALDTFNSISNINNKNNTFKYSNDKGVSWKTIKLPQDAYELKDIWEEIQMQMFLDNDFNEKDNSFYINFSVRRQRSVLEILNENYRVDFGVENSLAKIFGFNTEMLAEGIHLSPNVVNITSINSISVNVNFISGSYDNGETLPCIHSFYPNVGPGYHINERPNPELVWCDINVKLLDNVRVWLTDQDQNSIDNQGENVSVVIRIREKTT